MQEKRNHRAGDRADEQGEQEGKAHHDAQPQIVFHAVEHADDQQAANRPDDQTDGRLLQDESAVLVPRQFPRSDPANHQGEGLGSGIAGHPGNHRHEKGQGGQPGDRVFKKAHQLGGQHADEQQKHQPGNPPPGGSQGGGQHLFFRPAPAWPVIPATIGVKKAREVNREIVSSKKPTSVEVNTPMNSRSISQGIRLRAEARGEASTSFSARLTADSLAMSSWASSIKTSRMSSTVMMPRSRFSSSTTGMARKSYRPRMAATSSWSMSAGTEITRSYMISRTGTSGWAIKSSLRETT